MKTLIESMQWRAAVKKYTSQKLSDEQMTTLLEAIRLAPSSFGLQPTKVVVVTNPEVREKLKAAGYGQAQIAESSALVVFAVETVLDDAFVDRFIASISETRGVPTEALADYAAMMKGSLSSKTPEQRIDWAARQAYLLLGVLVTAAAVEGIDVGPMEGFDPKQFDEILGLTEKGLASKVMAAVGFRDETDPYLAMKKVRYPMNEVVIKI